MITEVEILSKPWKAKCIETIHGLSGYVNGEDSSDCELNERQYYLVAKIREGLFIWDSLSGIPASAISAKKVLKLIEPESDIVWSGIVERFNHINGEVCKII